MELQRFLMRQEIDQHDDKETWMSFKWTKISNGAVDNNRIQIRMELYRQMSKSF